MLKKVIALYGRPNVGKTQTIKMACEILKSKNKGCQTEEVASSLRDICVILVINGKKIGIESEGDPGGRLTKSLKTFLAKNCAVIVCATRTHGKTCDEVMKLEPKNCTKWIKQNYLDNESQHTSNNKKCAREIVKIVEEAIK